MKQLLMILALVAPGYAQWVVNDPINTMVNSAVRAGQAANHVEIMRKWAEELERLNRQIRQLEEQLKVQQRIRDIIGDPGSAAAQILLHDLGADELARVYGETAQAARRLASAINSLKRTADGIYRELDNRTVYGRDFIRQEAPYRRYAVVERQADSMAAVERATNERAGELQRDLAETLERMRTASTQSEADKLHAKLSALNGQLAHLDAQRRDEADKLWATQILNENQAAKERQDLLERQQAEERDSLAILGAWQRGIILQPGRYSQP